jgi:hypothetical protein
MGVRGNRWVSRLLPLRAELFGSKLCVVPICESVYVNLPVAYGLWGIRWNFL